MLNKNLFAEKMEELLVLFPNWNIEFDTKNMRVWYNQFSDLTDNEFKRMVETYVKNEQYHPTVGSLRKYIVKEFDSTRDNPTLQQVEEWKREAAKVPESTKLEFRKKMQELIKEKSNAQ